MLIKVSLLGMIPVNVVGHGTMSHGTVTEPDFVSDVEHFIETETERWNTVLRRRGHRERTHPLRLNESIDMRMRQIMRPALLYDPLRLTLVLITQP